jgi:pimeloyl-ACP methyl ester carboxylesterase
MSPSVSAIRLRLALAAALLSPVIAYAVWFAVADSQLRWASSVQRTSRGAVEYASSGDGPSVLVVHGLAGGYDQALSIIKTLPKGHFRYVAVSRPGYLRTPLSTGVTLDQQADSYAALLDALGIGKAALIAYSAGGHSAIPFVLRYPERCWALVLLSGHTQRMGEQPAHESAFSQVVTSVKMDLAVWSLSLFLRITPTQVAGDVGLFSADESANFAKLTDYDTALEFFHAAIPSVLRRAGIENDLRQMATSPDWPLEQIRVPVLVIHGDADPILKSSDALAAARRIPGAHIVRIFDGGHVLFLTRRSQVSEVIGRFLGVAARAATETRSTGRP